MTHYVIIGNGVAGVRVLESILKRDPQARVTALTDEPHAFYLRPQLPEFVAGRIGEGALRGRALDRLDAARFALRLGLRVAQVNTARKTLRLTNDESLVYDRLIIATGAEPKALGDLNERTPGVVRLKTLEDARRMRLAVQEASAAVVVGSGVFGVELFHGLMDRGLKVTYLVPEERFWPEALDATASRLAAEDLADAGVRLRLGATLDDIRVRDGRLVGAVTTTGELIECHVLGIGLGYAPAVEFLAHSGIETDRGVLVDEYLRTSAPDVYAAGDVAQLRRPAPGTAPLTVRWHNAWQQGHVAGGNAAGLKVSFPATVAMTTGRLLHRDLAVLGEGSRDAGSGLDEITGRYPQGRVYKRLVSREGRLTGALLYGDVSQATELIGHIRDRTAIDKLPRRLLRRLFEAEATPPGTPDAAPRGVVCPACKLELPRPPDAKEGDLLTCSACGIEMRLQRRGPDLVAVAV